MSVGVSLQCALLGGLPGLQTRAKGMSDGVRLQSGLSGGLPGLRKRATGMSDGVSLQSGLSGGLPGLRTRATGMSDGLSLQSGAPAVCLSSRGGCGAVGRERGRGQVARVEPGRRAWRGGTGGGGRPTVGRDGASRPPEAGCEQHGTALEVEWRSKGQQGVVVIALNIPAYQQSLSHDTQKGRRDGGGTSGPASHTRHYQTRSGSARSRSCR